MDIESRSGVPIGSTTCREWDRWPDVALRLWNETYGWKEPRVRLTAERTGPTGRGSQVGEYLVTFECELSDGTRQQDESVIVRVTPID